MNTNTNVNANMNWDRNVEWEKDEAGNRNNDGDGSRVVELEETMGQTDEGDSSTTHWQFDSTRCFKLCEQLARPNEPDVDWM